MTKRQAIRWCIFLCILSALCTATSAVRLVDENYFGAMLTGAMGMFFAWCSGRVIDRFGGA